MRQFDDFLPDFRSLFFGSSDYRTAIFARSLNAFVTRGTVFLGLVLYLQLRGNNFTSIALLTTVYFAPQLLFSLFAGRLSDALKDRRLFVSIGFVGSGILFIFYPLIGWIGYALILRFLQGILESAIRPLTQAIAATEGGSKSRGAKVSFFKTAVFAGSSLGPLTVGYLIQFFGYGVMFGGTAAAMIVAGITAWFFITPPEEEADGESISDLFSLRNVKEGLFHKSIFSAPEGNDPSPFFPRKIRKETSSLFLFTAFVRRLAFNMFVTFIPIYLASNLDLATGSVGTLEGMRRFMIVGAIVFSGTLADNWGRKPLLVMASFSFLGPIMYTAFPTLAGVWIAAIVLGLTIGLFNPTAITYVADLSPPGKRGTYLGFLESTSSVSRVLGPIIGGIIADFLGLPSVFLAAGLIMSLTVPLSFLLEETTPDEKAETAKG